MATTIRKAKLGVEDIHMDDQGTGAQVQTLKSDGTYRPVRKLNASHVPTTAVVRALSATATYVETALAELWALVLARLPKAGGTMTGAIAMGSNKITGLAAGSSSGDALHVGQLDGATVELNAGVVRVKPAGILAASLATDAVETAKIKDANVTEGKLAANAVVAAKITDGTITKAKLAWAPGFYPFYAGTVTIANATTDAVSVANLLSTDIVSLTVRTKPTNAVTIIAAKADAGHIDVEWSGAPGSTATADVIAMRAIP